MAEKLNPNAWAWFGDKDDVLNGFQYVDEDMIRRHVIDTGELYVDVARRFAEWANGNWNEYDDGSTTQTNGQIIAGMLAYWRGQ